MFANKPPLMMPLLVAVTEVASSPYSATAPYDPPLRIVPLLVNVSASFVYR
jgi:hypothetical protein